ncbi:hypothetical protein BLNAU_561 [Blattamonas nauphoetae]|uniref:Uncharacterized protein n=1 Tax=Blattamonas nauphoetae TaxID=2049346 RepID=A0ABQ9YLL5_9EUKA|nr:hypothetical protein BLNAU_561 [Blattamonas nauphoetae]
MSLPTKHGQSSQGRHPSKQPYSQQQNSSLTQSRDIAQQALGMSEISTSINDDEPSMMPSITGDTREDAKTLDSWLDEKLNSLSFRESELPLADYIDEAQKIFSAAFREIVRQVSIQSPERGQLIVKLWNKDVSFNKQMMQLANDLNEQANVKYRIEMEDYVKKFKEESENHLKTVHVSYGKELRANLDTINQLNLTLAKTQQQVLTLQKEAEENLKVTATMEAEIETLNDILHLTENKNTELETELAEAKAELQQSKKESRVQSRRNSIDKEEDWANVDLAALRDPDQAEKFDFHNHDQLRSTLNDFHALAYQLASQMPHERMSEILDTLHLQTDILNYSDFGTTTPKLAQLMDEETNGDDNTVGSLENTTRSATIPLTLTLTSPLTSTLRLPQRPLNATSTPNSPMRTLSSTSRTRTSYRDELKSIQPPKQQQITSEDVQNLVDALPEDMCGIWNGRKILSFTDLDALLTDMAQEIQSLRKEKTNLLGMSLKQAHPDSSD